VSVLPQHVRTTLHSHVTRRCLCLSFSPRDHHTRFRSLLCPLITHCRPEKSEQRLESDKLLRNQAGSRQTPSQRMHAGFVKADGFGGGSKPVFGSVVERYYTQMFKVDHAGRDHHDHFAYMHSNRMCITGLAPSHELITAHATNPVKSVSFQIHARGRVTRDLTVLQFSGKRKKGTPTVEGPTTICQVTMTDGRVYNIPACVERAVCTDGGWLYGGQCMRLSCWSYDGCIHDTFFVWCGGVVWWCGVVWLALLVGSSRETSRLMMVCAACPEPSPDAFWR